MNITGGRTFRENHKMWLRIQDTTISYLIARNPRLKKTNRVHYEQSLQQLLQWHLITNIISLTCLCLCLFVLSSLSPGTWRGECPAWPCPLGSVSLRVGAMVASSPHTPDNHTSDMFIKNIQCPMYNSRRVDVTNQKETRGGCKYSFRQNSTLEKCLPPFEPLCNFI